MSTVINIGSRTRVDLREPKEILDTSGRFAVLGDRARVADRVIAAFVYALIIGIGIGTVAVVATFGIVIARHIAHHFWS